MQKIDSAQATQLRLDALQSLIKSIDTPDEALQDLSNRTDPESTRQTLIILIEKELFKKAAEIAKEREFHVRWCDLAVRALVKIGDKNNARQFIKSAKDSGDLNAWHRCCIQYALTLTEGTEVVGKYAIGLHDPTADESKLAEESLEVLDPILGFVYGKNKVDSQLEAFAVERTIYLNRFLGRASDMKRLTNVLLTRSPISLMLVDLISSGFVEASASIPERIRNEHSGSFYPALQAALIEGAVLGNMDSVHANITNLLASAETDSEKEDACKVMFGLSQAAGNDAVETLITHATQLLGAEHALVKLFTAGYLVEYGNIDDAGKLINEYAVDKDAMWLQLTAIYQIKTEDVGNAIISMEKAAELAPSLGLLEMLANLSHMYGNVMSSEGALLKALRLNPSEPKYRRNLVSIYLENDDYQKASEHIDILRKSGQTDDVDMYNLAVCWMKTGNFQGALSILESLCSKDDATEQMFGLKANALRALGYVDEAFSTLDAIKYEYWDKPHFLTQYMGYGYAASREKEANEALLRLQDLKQQGKVEDTQFSSICLDDLKQHAVAFREKRETICENILVGKMPWVLGAKLLHEVPYWAWFVRTQPVRWPFDRRLDRAYYAIYATNGFSIYPDEDGVLHLQPLREVSKGVKAVIDISSLITLNELGLLEKATTFFDELIYPSLYLERIIEDTVWLSQHQKSQVSSLVAIKSAIVEKRIEIVDRSEIEEKISSIDEYKIWGSESYVIADVAETLVSNGMLTDTKKNELHELSHQDPTKPLVAAQAVCVELATLKTIASIELLGELVSCFEVCITKENKEEIWRDLSGYEEQERIRKRNSDLWSNIRGNKKLVPSGIPMSEKRSKDSEESRDNTGLSSALLAQDRNLPLVADDRVLQTIFFNSQREVTHIAIDTSFLVRSMVADGIVSECEHAKIFLQLIRWRYRFIMPTATTLMELLLPYLSNPPGSDLREVASYVHDCMKDPGLFAGEEKVEPSISLAVRLYQSWTRLIAVFLMDVWADGSISESKATELTLWAGKEFFPSVPENLDKNKQVLLAAQTGRTAISFALIECGQRSGRERMNKGLRCLAEALSVSPQEYFTYVTAIIDA